MVVKLIKKNLNFSVDVELVYQLRMISLKEKRLMKDLLVEWLESAVDEWKKKNGGIML